MARQSRFLASAAALAIAMAWSGLAQAGDGDYDAAAEAKGPIYYGLVADQRGKALPDVQVVLQANNHEPLVLKTTGLGLYRSHFGKDVPPEDVRVSCEKAGYRTTRVLRRGNQTNCTMEAH